MLYRRPTSSVMTNDAKCLSAIVERKGFLFWRRVNKFGPEPPHVPGIGNCWVWTGAQLGKGYGSLRGIRQETVGAHRFSWYLATGVLPQWPICVLHKCDTRLCVRPDHLFLGTRLDNSHDMVAKGRGRNGDVFRTTPPVGEKSPTAKLSNADVAEIREIYAAGGVTHRELAERYNVSRPHISGIITRSQRKIA